MAVFSNVHCSGIVVFNIQLACFFTIQVLCIRNRLFRKSFRKHKHFMRYVFNTEQCALT